MLQVRYIGVCNETSFGVMSFVRAAEQLNFPRIVSIQNQYNLTSRISHEVDLVETCRFCNVGLLAYSPLSGGALTGKYIPPQWADAKARYNYLPGFLGVRGLPLFTSAVEEYRTIANMHGISLAELALAFVKGRDFVTSTVIGARELG